MASLPALPEELRPGPVLPRDPPSASEIAAAAAAGAGANPAPWLSGQQQQHSLFVARAAWSSLRRAMLSLQEALQGAVEPSAIAALAHLQVSRQAN